MELRLNNGTVVHRLWGDSHPELLGGFQYQSDAEAFARAKLAEDTKNNWTNSYAVICTLSGKMTVIHPEKQEQPQ